MEENNIVIPLKYKEGTFTLKDITVSDEECLVFEFDKYGICECEVPVTSSHIRIYSLPEDVTDTIKITYDEIGEIQKVTYDNYGQNAYLYVNISTPKKREPIIDQYISQNVKKITDAILSIDEPIMRLIFDRFYDGESVNFYVAAGKERDRVDILKEYRNDLNALNNSGNYPPNEWIMADTKTLGIILMCCNHNESNKLFQEICDEMVNKIIKQIEDKIEKTEDYQLCVNQYD